MKKEREEREMIAKGFKKYSFYTFFIIEMNLVIGFVMKWLNLILMKNQLCKLLYNTILWFLILFYKQTTNSELFLSFSSSSSSSSEFISGKEALQSGHVLCYSLYSNNSLHTNFNQGIIHSGWNRCLHGRQTIISSFVILLSQTEHTGSFSNSFAVGWRWTIFLIKSFDVGGGPCYNQI